MILSLRNTVAVAVVAGGEVLSLVYAEQLLRRLDCSDSRTWCPQYKRRCSESWMKRKCEKTCGICTSSSTSTLTGKFGGSPFLPEGKAILYTYDQPGMTRTGAVVILEGLQPNQIYKGHLHSDICANGAGGHYQNDPQGAVDDENELWVEVHTDADGAGVDMAINNWEANVDDPRSIVLHDTPNNGGNGAGPKFLCADLK